MFPPLTGEVSIAVWGSRLRHVAGSRHAIAIGSRVARCSTGWVWRCASAGCLPRKELYEAWEVARRARRLFRGGRVVDLASGHGLLAQMMLILDDSSPSAVGVDKIQPPCAARVHESLVTAWPRLAGRIRFSKEELDSVAIEPGDIVVSATPAADSATSSSTARRPPVRGWRCFRAATTSARATRVAGRMAGPRAGDRRGARRPAPRARLPRVDAGDLAGDHAQEPVAAGGAGASASLPASRFPRPTSQHRAGSR